MNITFVVVVMTCLIAGLLFTASDRLVMEMRKVKSVYFRLEEKRKRRLILLILPIQYAAFNSPVLATMLVSLISKTKPVANPIILWAIFTLIWIVFHLVRYIIYKTQTPDQKQILIKEPPMREKVDVFLRRALENGLIKIFKKNTLLFALATGCLVLSKLAQGKLTLAGGLQAGLVFIIISIIATSLETLHKMGGKAKNMSYILVAVAAVGFLGYFDYLIFTTGKPITPWVWAGLTYLHITLGAGSVWILVKSIREKKNK